LPAEATSAARLDKGVVRVSTERPVELLHALTGWALERSTELEGLEVRRPSLEDVYLELTAAHEEAE
jgi:ABC-2 type transport system ATP-binding protein